MRRTLSGLGAAVLIAGPTILAFFSGGYFDRPRLVAAIVAWALVIAAALLVPRPLPTTRSGQLALAGMGLLTAWTALSITWAPIAGRAQDDLERLVLYLGFFIASIALLRGSRVRRWLEPGVVLGTLVVVAYGLSERLVPGLVELDRSFAAAGRLEQPLTYWNGFSLVAAVGFVLAVRLAGDPERPRPLRGAASAAGVILGLGVYLTFARGALAAVAAGLLVLVALAPAGRAQLRSVVTLVGAATVASLVASRFPTVESLERGVKGDVGDGLQMLAVVLVLGLGAAIVVLRTPRRELPIPPLPVSRRTAVMAIAAIIVVAATVTAATLEGKPETVSPVRGANPARLGSIDTNRYRYWDVAIETWAKHPLAGTGSGGFIVEWLKQRDRVDQSGDAHSIYLETPAELGLVGLAFLLLFAGGVAAAVLRLDRREPSVATGVAAGLAAWWLHAGLDWDWEMPAVGLLMFLLAAAAIAWNEDAAAPASEIRDDSRMASAYGERSSPSPASTPARQHIT